MILAVFWAACLAFFGYLLILSIVLVTPVENQEAVKSLSTAATSFFGFLGLIIGHIVSKLTNPAEVHSSNNLKPDEPANDWMLDKYKTKLEETIGIANKYMTIADHNAFVAIKALSYKAAFSVTICFAICHIISAGIQGLIQEHFSTEKLVGVLFFVVSFAQSEILLICAIAIPLFSYKHFLKQAGNSKYAQRAKYCTRIGGLGLFSVGFISLITQSPEQLSAFFANDTLLSIPTFHINYLVYLGVVRIIIYPIIGILTCYVFRYI
jgi:hypothetical protein